jgi:isopentenyl phosphate kinase
MPGLTFLKLGGSLITDKDRKHTAHIEQLDLLLIQVKAYLDEDPQNRVLLGHGSGSFGHHAAQKYGTRTGVVTPVDWQGFAEVWNEARALNQIVLERATFLGLHPICFPFSSSAATNDHLITGWDTASMRSTLRNGLLPVVYGDVSFDSTLGGTIVSTEEQFLYLAHELNPQRILLAGLEPGIWRDYPTCTDLIAVFKQNDLSVFGKALTGSASIDVTGGMASKVQIMFDIINGNPSISVQIFSGKEPGALLQALHGEDIGTRLTA